jgi:hypothetical protein
MLRLIIATEFSSCGQRRYGDPVRKSGTDFWSTPTLVI